MGTKSHCKDCTNSLATALRRGQVYVSPLYQAGLKVCIRCQHALPYADFSPHRRTRDRLNSWCKPCFAEYVRDWRSVSDKYTPSKESDPMKYTARMRLGSAVRSGDVVRPETCPECGNTENIEAHHADYSKPLEVEWLCRMCHMSAYHRIAS